MRLTELACRRARKGEKPYKLSDGKGLYLLMPPRGTKGTGRWIFRYSFFGKEKSISFGLYPDISLSEAREKREATRKMVAGGTDPSYQRKVNKLQKTEDRENTFKVVAEEWLSSHKNNWTENYQKSVNHKLQNCLYPYIGGEPIRQISSHDLLEALRRTESKGFHATTKRSLQLAGRIFKFAVRMKLTEYDITSGMREDLVTSPTEHRSAITEPADVGKLLLAIDAYKEKGGSLASLALSLLPLVFTRPKELITGEWKEINFEKSLWYIPAKKMKMRQDHIVPLSRQALKILHEIREQAVTSPYILPNSLDSERPMSDSTITQLLRNFGYKGKHCPHGFRATARTLLDEQLGFRVDWIEHQLAHTVKDPLGRAYNRTKFLKERQEMMQEYAEYLDKLKAKAATEAKTG